MLSIGFIDLGIIAIFILAIIIGIVKGFPKRNLGSLANSAGWVVGYFLGGFISRLLAQTQLSFMLQQMYQGFLPTSDAFSATVSTELSANTALYTTALGEMYIPTFFQGFIVNHVLDTSSTVAASIASSFAYLTIIVACFAILFILTVVLVNVILNPLWEDGALFDDDGKSVFGRICGVVQQFASKILWVFSIMSALSLVNQLLLKNNSTVLSDWITQDMSLNDASAFSIGKLFYNTADSFFSWITLPSL